MSQVIYTDDDFKSLECCPMCGSKKHEFWYDIAAGGVEDRQGNMKSRKVDVVRCECGFAYSKQVFTQSGSDKYWSVYGTQVHEADPQDVANRNQMYEMEYEFVSELMGGVQGKKILDIGCGEGRFLDVFARDGAICAGVEIGDDSIRVASERHKIYAGAFPAIEIDDKYDLVIFRGTVQFFEDPTAYLKKAIRVLAEGGYIMITSSPNADAFAHKLFKSNFVLPINAIARNGFSPKVLKNWFKNEGLHLAGETYFYEGTPYCNLEENIARVAKAMELQSQGKEIDFRAHAFWGNMFTVVFRK